MATPNFPRDIGRTGGVWEGHYRRMKPDGTLIEEYASRQESRPDGDTWHERITYRWADGRSKTMDFVARLHPDGVHEYAEDSLLRGRTFLTGEGQVVFPYAWHDKPGVNVLEVQHYINPRKRTRMWQRFENDALVEIMVIQEERVGEPILG